MAGFLQDMRYAIRSLRKSPSFAVVAVLTLALGIGANSTLFTLVDAVLLRPTPGVNQPGELVELSGMGLSYPSYRDLRDGAATQIDLVAFRDRQMAWRGSDQSGLVTGGVVSGNYFTTLGVRAALGRVLIADDDQSRAPSVAVLSYGYWRRALGGDSALIGKQVSLNGAPVTVIGVAAPGFRGLWLSSAPDLWVPIAAWPRLAPSSYQGVDLQSRNWSWLTVAGRLKPGVTVAQAATAVTAAFAREYEAFPNQVESPTPVDLRSAALSATGELPRDAVVRFSVILLAVVGLVLLIACANVANLLLARAAHRRREFALRLALGANRVRLVRQLLAETLLLALLAGGIGLGFMAIATALLQQVSLPGGIPLESFGLNVDGRVVGFTVLLSVVVSVAFGMAPALRASRPDLVSGLKAGPSHDGGGRSLLRASLVSVQVALSLVLLIGAGLFARGLQRALRIDPGFQADHIALAGVNLGLVHGDTSRAAAFYGSTTDRLKALPGVTHVAWATFPPLSPDVWEETAGIPGYVRGPGEQVTVELNFVSADYFSALKIPVTDGRGFEPGDVSGSRHVAVVNQTMARRYWAGRSPIGQILVVSGDTLSVVGVARDSKYHALAEDPIPLAYLPLSQRLSSAGLGPLALLVRSESDPAGLPGLIRRDLQTAAPDVPLFGLSTFSDQFNAVLMPQRLGVLLLGFFAVLATIVAAVGVYGVVAYTVSRSTREIGIRVALGARPGGVLQLMLARNLGQVAVGLGAGLLLAAAVTRVASSFLYGVSPFDPLSFGAMALVLLAAAVFAGWLPARRAARVDPVIALRAE